MCYEVRDEGIWWYCNVFQWMDEDKIENFELEMKLLPAKLWTSAPSTFQIIPPKLEMLGLPTLLPSILKIILLPLYVFPVIVLVGWDRFVLQKHLANRLA